MFPSFSCIVSSILAINTGSEGPDLVTFFGRSKNVLKSVASDQESLISYFGIIKTLDPPPIITLRNPEKPRNRIFFSALLEPSRGVRRGAFQYSVASNVG